MRRPYPIAILAPLLLPVAAQAQQPKITKDSAQSVALARVPKGTIRSAELEHERGTLVYSFDIVVPGKSGVEEVLVSALDGHVISTKHESAKAERTEQQKEQQEHQRKARKAAGDSAPQM